MSTQEKKLFLLDAMALIYRAHFAFSKNPRLNSKGQNTGAVLGFTNSLLDILNRENPSHIAVAFDTTAPTFRHIKYPAYKAQREEMPEDIRFAVPVVKDLVRAFNIPVLQLEGYEADDIIGTIAKRAAPKGFTVYMMTPDKDFAQLVEDRILLYKPAYMGNAVDVLGTEEVLKKFDIDNVDQVRDILGLQGDSSDNIPGIPGVGAKTAIKFLKEYGSVEGLIENTDKLKGKQKEKVEQFKDQGLLSKELATIRTDVPLDIAESIMEYKGFDEKKLKQVFDELEFRTLAKRVFGATDHKSVGPENAQMQLFGEVSELSDTPATEGPSALKRTIFNTPHDYHLIESAAMAAELAGHLHKQKEFCFDTETSGLNARTAELVGISFAYIPGEAYYVGVPEDRRKVEELLDLFKPVLEDQSILKIGQNIKYDIMVLKNYGVQVSGPLFDTMIAHYLFEPETRHNMNVMAESYLHYIPVSIETLIGKKGSKQKGMRDANVAEVAEYAGEDADITLQLKQRFQPLLKEHGIEKLFREVEVPLIRVLADMEYEGVRVDKDALKELSLEMQAEIIKVEREIYEMAGVEFNIASPKQLGDVLFETLKLVEKPKKTRTGQYATGEEILNHLAREHPIASSILDYREYQKLKSTYIDSLPDLISVADGRIHTSYNQAVAATGRLSSTNPNLQNIPVRTERGRAIRKAFVPRNDDFVLFSADYSQIELRIMAAFSGDESMIAAFRQGRDIHVATASKIFKVEEDAVDEDMRRKAKTANFGIIYGISAFGLSQRLRIPRGEASDIIQSYFSEFPAVKAYMDRVINEARDRGYVETVLGRRRYLRDIGSKNMTMRGFAERNAINAPIQGSAADMIKIAMIHIHDWMMSEGLRSKMILQVHDELVFDVHKPEQEIIRERVPEFMKHAIELDVPMDVGLGFGTNWLEAH